MNKDKIRELVDRAYAKEKSITVITYYLSNYGEHLLNGIGERLLELFNRRDIGDIVYTAVKELVMNAAKANLKRVLMSDYGLDPEDPDGHQKLMALFKENIRETRIKTFRDKFKERCMPIVIRLEYKRDEVLTIKVKNAFSLMPHEEKRVREKFKLSQKYSNLMEYYMDHGDDTEGAGMGITLVEILLSQSGMDRHLFTIYTDHRLDQTIARVEIPLSPDYVPIRLRHAEDLNESRIRVEDIRQPAPALVFDQLAV
ncbi:MAG: hypothetical protein KDK39_04610 [Leptospiraceae bacterium]|nr:hypothetical protein [Leptospiraceae bacterium]